MADVTIDPENANPKELYGQGFRAFVLQDYDTAVSAFSQASELLAAEHGNDLHDSLGDVYLYYGKSLLELSRKESGPLGEAVLKNVEEESEEEGEPEEEGKGDGQSKEEANGEGKGDEQSKEEENGQEEDKKEVEEELTDLQVAWEVLELAKTIFKARGEDGKKNLAETLITLGEISLESGNFVSAIEDITEGLNLQKTLFGDDSRTVAETFYKLGGAYATNAQIEEALESFTSSVQYLENKIASLKKEEKESNAEEIEELDNLLPELKEKIADMKNLKAEIAKKASEAAPNSNGTAEAEADAAASASSSKQATDISHLVKRKRKEDDAPETNPPKKPSP